MLTRNDKCFFALAFYRQTRQEVVRAYERQDYAQTLILGAQAQYWWDLYTSRRKESRIHSIQGSIEAATGTT